MSKGTQAGHRLPDLEEYREARVAGIRDFASPTLESVEQRRWQLLGFASFVMVGLAIGFVILTTSPQLLAQITSLPLYVLRILFLGLTVLLGLYLFDKETRLRNLTRKLVDERVLSAALNNRLKELSILSEVGKAINQVLDLEDVLRTILRSALDLLDAEEGSVMLVNEAGTHLEVAAAVSGSHREVEGATVPLGEGVSGWVAEHLEPLVISGSAPTDFFKSLFPRDRPVASSVCVPLVGEGELYGVLNVNDMTGQREFTEYDLRACSLFAEHAAIAIRNARAYEKERRLVQQMAEIDRMKTEFIGTMSHELRTPLTSIIGCAKTIRKRGDRLDDSQRVDFLFMIERQGERLLRMIEDVLSASKIESGQGTIRRERMDLMEVVEETVEAFKAAGGSHSLVLEGPQEVAVFADSSAVEQVLSNLIENAMKYSDPGSEVTILVEDRPGAASVSVVDEGYGIPADRLDSIFDRFRQVDQSATRRRGGVGLGLYIVKNLVEASGGTISVSSQEGKGSTFTVTFPKRVSDSDGPDTSGR